MREIIWSKQARDDLVRIERWLDENWESPNVVQTLAAIRQRCQFLLDFPHGGSPLTNDWRKLHVPETPYLLVYKVRSRAVEIVRVFHEREDWQAGR
jgi:addiction module RelE/StbE family toxin